MKYNFGCNYTFVKISISNMIVLLVTLFGGEVVAESRVSGLSGAIIINMGAIPNNRAVKLVDIANQSTCDNKPLDQNRCIGIISAGDRVVVGDNYIIYLDLTRNDGKWGGGGGGLLRGVWLLHRDASGEKNFKYLANEFNHAPNNLYPLQNVTPGIDTGDAFEILALPKGGSDPIDTYRASASSFKNTVIYSDGIYNTTQGWEHTYFHISGLMTKGLDMESYTTNIGEESESRLHYHLEYWFFNNNYYGSGDRNNSYQIQIKASVDVDASPIFSNTKELDTLLFSLGFSNIDSDSQSNDIRIIKFSPVSHAMHDRNYPFDPSLCGDVGLEYPILPLNDKYVLKDEWVIRTNSNPNWPFFSSLRTESLFEAKFLTGSDLQFFINRSTVGSANVVPGNSSIDLFGLIFHQLLYDKPNGVVVYDIKIGDSNQCQSDLGILSKGDVITTEYYLSLEVN